MSQLLRHALLRVRYRPDSQWQDDLLGEPLVQVETPVVLRHGVAKDRSIPVLAEDVLTIDSPLDAIREWLAMEDSDDA